MTDATPTIGSLAQTACSWEVLARKAGNVCPGREFPDLTVNDFLQSAAAVAPILDAAPRHPLGITILRAIEATRNVVTTNTNLGIVLLLAPLASVPLDEPLAPGLSRVLPGTTVEDARNVYTAIRLAKPGGLGEVKDQDVHAEPTLPLREVMALARDRDQIAAEYASGFTTTMWLARELGQAVSRFGNVERAIVAVQLMAMSRQIDTLIARKLGVAAAEEVRARASAMKEIDQPISHATYRKFDAFLRSDHHARNPGTTADLIAAAVFFALREGWISLATPFHWQEHPFKIR